MIALRTRARRPGPLTWRLGMLLVAATAAALSGWSPKLWPGPAVVTSPVGVSPDSDAAKPTGATPTASDDGAFLAHPLFDPTREPWRPPPPVLPAAPIAAAPPARPPIQPPRGYVVIGMATTGAEHLALLRSATGQILRLIEGQPLDGWTVEHIGDGRILLRQDAATAELAFPKIPATRRGAGP